MLKQKNISKKKSIWYLWSTYDTKKASKARRKQWYYKELPRASREGTINQQNRLN